MLQSVSSVFVVYRRKTLTGSPDPTHANGTDKACISNDNIFLSIFFQPQEHAHFADSLLTLRCVVFAFVISSPA